MGAFGTTLNELKQNDPELGIQLIAGLSSNFLNQVMEGTLDASLLTESSPFALPQTVQWTELYKEPMILILPNSIKSSRSHDSQLPVIRFEQNTWTGHLVEQTIKVNKLKIQDNMELNSVAAIIELVRQGLGYSIVPKRANIAWAEDRQLSLKELSGKTIYRKVGLLERRKHGDKMLLKSLSNNFYRE